MCGHWEVSCRGNVLRHLLLCAFAASEVVVVVVVLRTGTIVTVAPGFVVLRIASRALCMLGTFSLN